MKQEKNWIAAFSGEGNYDRIPSDQCMNAPWLANPERFNLTRRGMSA
jgi:hypothetical protein